MLFVLVVMMVLLLLLQWSDSRCDWTGIREA